MATSKKRQALIRETGYALQAYQRSTQAFDDAVARALNLNATDLRCLDWLADGPKSAGELAAGVALSTAATTTLIDRLERRGLVRRVRDAQDRRRVVVEMTFEGQEATWRYYGPLVEEGGRLLDDVKDEQLAQMRDWLTAARSLTDRRRERIDYKP
jgi:DNA-binding MarR family transcriptional regulator